MIDFILSQLSSWAGWLVTGACGLAMILLQRWRIKRMQDTIEQQDRAISTYKAKDEINRQDRETDVNTDSQINDLRRRVEGAGSQEQAAQEIAGGLNDYFSSKVDK